MKPPSTPRRHLPRYLACARALALATGVAATTAGCNTAPLTTDPGKATGGTGGHAYDGGPVGLFANPDAAEQPYDGGPMGSKPNPADAHPAYDGGPVGLVANPDAHAAYDPDAAPKPTADGGAADSGADVLERV